MTTRFYGLDGLDRLIIDQIGTEPGFFFEAGANDGVTQSNTKCLEESFGWRGLLVEPIPDRHKACIANRPGSIVEWGGLTSADDPRRMLKLAFCDLMTITKSGDQLIETEQKFVDAGRKWLKAGETVYEFEAPALTISGLLRKHGNPKVDLMSLDLEGFEPQAIRGIDFAAHVPRHIVIEARPANAAEIKGLLAERYQEPVMLKDYGVRWDWLFTRR